MKNMIITADWHLRDEKPKCRPKDEDWMSLQMLSLFYLYDIAEKNNADIFVCGDIFHYANVSNRLLNMLLDVILNATIMTYILPGQHDLQHHSLEEIFSTSCGVLYSVALKGNTNLRLIKEVAMAAPFGKETFQSMSESRLYFTHRLCTKEKSNYITGGMGGISAYELLNKYPGAKMMFVGDNHNHFDYCDSEKRRIFVPGCLTRQKYDMQNYKPGFYLLKFENEFSFQFIENIHDNVKLVQDNHIEKKEDHNESINSFVEKLKGVSQKNLSLSFLDTLREAIEKGTLENECVSFIQEMIEKVRK